jgi:hypothetical protein
MTTPSPPAPVRNPSLGFLSLGFGIAALPLLFCVFFGIPSGLLAVGFGVAALRRGTNDKRAAAIAGIALGLLGVALGVFFIARPDD